jgi:hypothetical protein
MKASERIINAVIGTPPPHPLSKSKCPFCPAWVMRKDMEKHLWTEHQDEGDRTANDYDHEETNQNH